MLYISWIISIIEVLLVTLPVLFIVAFVTVAERKTMASMQRRVGPNIVGYYGLLQAFADAVKLLLKEYVSPTQANLILFFLGPIITLVFSLLGYAVVPFAPGLAISDFDLGILYVLAVSSLATYGILLAGWSANSKYAFLGSLRSTAQLISYELILSSAVLLVILVTGSLNLTVNIEAQKAIWFIVPLFPIFLIFFIGSVAETNRAPFDLAEAESELVSGFMTEHSAVIFVFFFLAEYASIVLMCILITILFLGGYNIDCNLINYLIDFSYLNFMDAMDFLIASCKQFLYFIYSIYYEIGASFIRRFGFNPGLYIDELNVINGSLHIDEYLINPVTTNFIYAFVMGFKTFVMIFIFIWVRASFPRIRFDQLMSYCWTVLLPLVFAFILLIPCILYILEMFPVNSLFFVCPIITTFKIRKNIIYCSRSVAYSPKVLCYCAPADSNDVGHFGSKAIRLPGLPPKNLARQGTYYLKGSTVDWAVGPKGHWNWRNLKIDDYLGQAADGYFTQAQLDSGNLLIASNQPFAGYLGRALKATTMSGNTRKLPSGLLDDKTVAYILSAKRDKGYPSLAGPGNAVSITATVADLIAESH